MQLNQPFRKGEIDVKRDNSSMDGNPQHLHNSFLYPPKNVLKSRVSVLPYIFFRSTNQDSSIYLVFGINITLLQLLISL